MVMTYTEVTLRYGLHAVHRSRMCLHPGDSTDVSHPEGSTVWMPLRITYHAVTFRISVHAVITLDSFSHALTSRKTPTKSPMAPGLRAHKKYPSSPISVKGWEHSAVFIFTDSAYRGTTECAFNSLEYQIVVIWLYVCMYSVCSCYMLRNYKLPNE